MEQLNLQFSI